jgi:hypothetical protein
MCAFERSRPTTTYTFSLWVRVSDPHLTPQMELGSSISSLKTGSLILGGRVRRPTWPQETRRHPMRRLELDMRVAEPHN